MELRQLRSFVALAEELHFQRAARLIGVTQPTLSHQIKTLEEELGFKLFDRDRSKVDLSPTGGFFYDRVEPLLTQLDGLVLDAKEHAGAAIKPLRIGTNSFINLPVLMKTKVEIQQRHPEITVETLEMATSEVFDAVKEKQADLGFGPIPPTHPALIIKKVVTGFWSLVLPREHALAGSEQIDISRLGGIPLVCFDKALNPKLHDWLMRQFKEAGVRPDIIFDTRQIQSGLQMARDSKAGFIVASYLVDQDDPRFRIIPITGMEKSTLTVYCAWREENDSPALKTYLNLLDQGIQRP